MDISIIRKIDFNLLSLELGFCVYNLYNQKNIFYRNYINYEDQIQVRDTRMLGYLATIFAQLNFRK